MIIDSHLLKVRACQVGGQPLKPAFFVSVTV
jgi:hypothetical protein